MSVLSAEGVDLGGQGERETVRDLVREAPSVCLRQVLLRVHVIVDGMVVGAACDWQSHASGGSGMRIVAPGPESTAWRNHDDDSTSGTDHHCQSISLFGLQSIL
jgi:hypothetical protein